MSQKEQDVGVSVPYRRRHRRLTAAVALSQDVTTSGRFEQSGLRYG